MTAIMNKFRRIQVFIPLLFMEKKGVVDTFKNLNIGEVYYCDIKPSKENTPNAFYAFLKIRLFQNDDAYNWADRVEENGQYRTYYTNHHSFVAKYYVAKEERPFKRQKRSYSISFPSIPYKEPEEEEPETEEEHTIQDTIVGSLSSTSSLFTALEREEINREYDDIENQIFEERFRVLNTMAFVEQYRLW